MTETQVRRYPANDQTSLDRDRHALAAEGWEITSIDYTEERRGCGLPVIGVLMFHPPGSVIVTYRRRDWGIGDRGQGTGYRGRGMGEDDW